MKLFRKENGKEVVYIQCKDLNLITQIEPLSRTINIDFSMEALLMSNFERYVKLENSETIEKLKNMYFIIDFDEFQNLDEDEIHDRYTKNINQIEKLKKQIKKSKESEKKILLQAYITRSHYSDDMDRYLGYRKCNKVPEYRNVIN